MSPEAVTVRTPSTLGNFGPGFDAFSMAIATGGDHVTVQPAADDRVTITGPGADTIPTAWAENSAAAAFSFLRHQHRSDLRVHMHIDKRAPPGSGMGSSAASSAAGALAFAKMHRDLDWTLPVLHTAAVAGEAAAAGPHGDDVAASLQGGLALVLGNELRRIDPPHDLHIAIVRPAMTVATRTMRAAVPALIPREDVVHNLANVARIVDALHRDDIAGAVGALADHVATPYRKAHLPFFDAAREAAQAAGAPQIAIGGSGPTLFTLTHSETDARRIAAAMTEAVRATGVDAEAIACQPEHRHVWKEELSA